MPAGIKSSAFPGNSVFVFVLLEEAVVKTFGIYRTTYKDTAMSKAQDEFSRLKNDSS